MTPDGKPLIGCAPGADRIVVATGHNMLGLSLAAPTASLVAALVAVGPAAAVPAFDPMRFTDDAVRFTKALRGDRRPAGPQVWPRTWLAASHDSKRPVAVIR